MKLWQFECFGNSATNIWNRSLEKFACGKSPFRVTLYSELLFFAFIRLRWVTHLCMNGSCNPHKVQTCKHIKMCCLQNVNFRAFLFITNVWLPLSIDISGSTNRFFSIFINKREVYYSFCKGYIGHIQKPDKNDVMIQYFWLVRIDPRHLISIRVNETHDRRSSILYHRHITQLVTFEKDPKIPIGPIALTILRRGLMLATPCAYAKELACAPSIASADHQRLSLNNIII